MVLNRTRMDRILPIHGTMTEVFRKGGCVVEPRGPAPQP